VAASVDEDDVVVVSPVGRTGTTPVAVNNVWVVVTVNVVEEMLWEESSMHEDIEAQA
jgi:hypothetical protein